MAQILRCVFREVIRNEESNETEYGSPFTFNFGYAKAQVSGSFGGLNHDDCEVGTNIKYTPIFSNVRVDYQAFDLNGDKLGFTMRMESLPSENRLNRYIFSLNNEETGLHMLFYDKYTGTAAGDNPVYLIVPKYWSDLNPTSLRELAEKIENNYYLFTSNYFMDNNIFCGFMFMEATSTDSTKANYQWSQSWGSERQFYHNLSWGSSWYKLITNDYMVDSIELETVDDKVIRLSKGLTNKTYTIHKYPDRDGTLRDFAEPLVWYREPVLGTDLGYLLKNYNSSIELKNGSTITFKVENTNNENFKKCFIQMFREGELSGEPIVVQFKGTIFLPFSGSGTYRNGITYRQETFREAGALKTLSWIDGFRKLDSNGEIWSTTPDDAKANRVNGTYLFISPEYNEYDKTELESVLAEKISETWNEFPDRVIGIGQGTYVDQLNTLSHAAGETISPRYVYLSNYYFSWNDQGYSTYSYNGSTVNEFDIYRRGSEVEGHYTMSGEIEVNSSGEWLFLLGIGSSPIEPEVDPEYGGGSIGGGGNRRGGGNGKFNDKGDNIGKPGMPSGLGSTGFLTQWYLGGATEALTRQNVGIVGRWLSNWKLFSSYQDRLSNICSLKVLYAPITPDHGSLQVVYCQGKEVRGSNLEIAALVGYAVDNSFDTHNIGNFTIEEYFGNFLDYTHTRIKIFLPFSGVYELNPNDIIGNKCTLYYNIDWMSGNIMYIITVKDSDTGYEYVKYRFTGNCCTEIPITSEDYGNKISSGVNTIIGIAATAGNAMVGNYVGAVASGVNTIGSAVSALSDTETNINGVSAGPTGALDVKTPYLMITRPKMAIPNDFGSIYGWKSSVSGKLNQYKGFTKVAECHLEGLSQASSDEIDEIENLLKEGVILPK